MFVQGGLGVPPAGGIGVHSRGAMTLRAALAFIWLVSFACSFDSPGGPGGRDAAPGDGTSGSCTEGQACDDMQACTEYDVCVAGECRGVATSACSGCASTCDATCGGSTCCTQSCPGGTCPTCPMGCSCDLTCGTARPCNVTCSAGAVCNVYGTNINNDTDGNYNMTCATGSICSLDCVGDEGTCAVTCAAGASCLLDCRNKTDDGNQCNITGCPVAVTRCTGAYDGVQVCGRPCPT
jgi:hypothetical protein